MTENSRVIILMCSHLCCGLETVPLDQSEWTALSDKLAALRRAPSDMLRFSDGDFAAVLGLGASESVRYRRLLDRTDRIAAECARLQKLGVDIVTEDDGRYPKRLRDKLDRLAPPMLYCCGDPSVLDGDFLGIVGSRDIDGCDAEFAENLATTAVGKGFGIVSGGARGVDTAAADAVMKCGGKIVEFIADSMLRRMKSRGVSRRLRDGKHVMLSVTMPDAAFHIGMAMQSNKYIYSQSLGTVVVRTEYKRGGTWAGATENIRQNRSATYCLDKPDYPGNVALIGMGAIPIGADFDPDAVRGEKSEASVKQLSFFDF